MKTTRNWLETIADKEIREAAIRNCIELNQTDVLNSEAPNSLHRSIAQAFDWDKSTELYEYWDNIYTQALNGTLKTIEN